MMGYNFSYSIREAFSHFRRNWSTALGAVVTIFLSLFIIGIFMLGSSLLNNLMGSVEDKVTIQLFLSDNANQDQVNALTQEINGWSEVDSVSYKSKEQAAQEYRETMGSSAMDALEGANPLPASLAVKVKDSQTIGKTADKLAADQLFLQIADTPSTPTASIQYGQGTVERLFTVTNYVRIIALALVVLLIFVAFVFINNTIRLAIAARRREIAIMRLVGASNGFIRGPFIMEGILEAVLGAVLAIVILQVGVTWIMPALQNNLAFLEMSLSTASITWTYLLLVLLGVIIGFLGSLVAMRRYLRV